MSSTMALVSIVMGVYNGERYLADQIRSILAQTHLNFELLVFDDGSNDGSVALAESLAAEDRRVRVIRNASNKGLVANFLDGLRLARGEFVAFSDQDDVWNPRKIETLLDVLERNPNNMLAFSDMEVCDEKLDLSGFSFWQTESIHPKMRCLGEKAVLRNLAPGCSMLFRGKVKDEVIAMAAHPNFTNANAAKRLDDTPFMHDHLVFVIASLLGSIDYTPEKLVLYRQHMRNNIGAQYVSAEGCRSMQEQLSRKLDILEAAGWVHRDARLSRLRDFSRCLKKNSPFGTLPFFSYHLYMRPATCRGKVSALAACLLPFPIARRNV